MKLINQIATTIAFMLLTATTTLAQIKLATCMQGNNRFGTITNVLNTSGDYIGGVPSTCQFENININNTNDTVVVRENTTITRANLNNTINGVVIVYGTLDLQTGNQSLTINSNGQLLVYGTITGGNNTSINLNGYMLIADGAVVSTGNGPNADFTINGGGIAEINGSITTPKLTNNGVIVGTGTITGDIINQGSINGSTSSVNTSVTNLGSDRNSALVWQPAGPSWNGSAPGSGDNDISGLVLFFDEDFTINHHPGDFNRRFNRFNISNGKALKANGAFVYSNRININGGELVFDNNARIDNNSKVETSNNGKIVMEKTLSWTGWHFFNFPVDIDSDLTLGSISISNSNGFNYNPNSAARNIYQWDAANSSWVSITLSANTTLAGQTFFYWGNNGGVMRLEADEVDFNNRNQMTALSYNNPGPASNPPGGSNGWATSVTDGWVMIQNPFQDELDWEKVRQDIIDNFGSDFQETAVYQWNGSSYETWNGSGGSARFVSPYTPVFVRISPSASSQFNMKNAYRRDRPNFSGPNQRVAPSDVSLFLTAQGDGFHVQTEIGEHPLATNDFNGYFDAHYMPPMSNAPLFFTVTEDSLSVSINQKSSLEDTTVVSFAYGKDGEIFSIGLSQFNLPSFVEIMFYDTYLDTVVDLSNSNYEFIFDEDAPVERFRLFMNKNGLRVDNQQHSDFEINEQDAVQVRAWFSVEGLHVELSENVNDAQLSLVNASGQTVVSKQFKNIKETKLDINGPAGMYMVWIHSKNFSGYKKVMKF